MSMSAFGSITYQKGKLNVIKRHKISFLGLYVLLTGSWNLKDIQNSRQNRSKNNVVRENVVTQAHRTYLLWAPRQRLQEKVCL